MSAGFEFAKKHEITICGRAYPCDISDKRMLEGVTRDFPRVLQAAQAFCAMDAKLKPGVTEDQLWEAYHARYDGEYFVRLLENVICLHDK